MGFYVNWFVTQLKLMDIPSINYIEEKKASRLQPQPSIMMSRMMLPLPTELLCAVSLRMVSDCPGYIAQGANKYI